MAIRKEKDTDNKFSETISDRIKRGLCRVTYGLWGDDSDPNNSTPKVMVTISSPLYNMGGNIYYDSNNAEMPAVYFSGFDSTMDVRCFAELREMASDIIEATEVDSAEAWIIIDISYGRIASVKFPKGFSEPMRKMLQKFIIKATNNILEKMSVGKFTIAITYFDGWTTIFVGRSDTPHFEKLNVCCLTLKHSKVNLENCIDLSDAAVNIYRITTRAANVTIKVKDCNISKLDVFNAAGMSDSDKRNCVRLLKQAAQKVIEQIGSTENEFEINIRTW